MHDRFAPVLETLTRPSYGFSNAASTVTLPPGLTVRVRRQGLKPVFSIEMACSPGAIRTVDAVLPTYFPSTVISAPSGVDLIITLEYSGLV